MFSYLLALSLVCSLVSSSASALDELAEQRFGEQLKAGVTVGKVISLENDHQAFLAIDTQALTSRVLGGVIFLPSIGEHADWLEIITPLRADLPKIGWRTLSLQLPLIDDLPSDFDDYMTESLLRLASAIEYFNQAGVYNIVVAGHGVGAAIAIKYLDSHKQDKSTITAVVAISMYVPGQVANRFDLTQATQDINVPLLDMIGSVDFDDVLRGAQARKKILLNLNKAKYHPLTLNGADHSYTGMEKVVVKRIRSWIDKYAPSFEIKQKPNAMKSPQGTQP